ncbi:MAG TPA: EcsC family protein [Polyangiales bacterium]|nr:EcsC family protein [Polyangiales bacterium]
MELSLADREALLQAKLILEHPGFLARAAELLGHPIERGLLNLPPTVQSVIVKATQSTLKLGLSLAVASLDRPDARAPKPRPALMWYRVAGGVAGAAGGFFGLLALPAELPISTLIILRAIADVARSEGEDLSVLEARMACLEVLALSGGQPESARSAETGYYAARIGLAQSFKKAVEHVGREGLGKQVAPPVAEWITRVGAKYSVRVSHKVIAKAIPLVGAASGAAINSLFVQHFQDVARAHFTIRRLERAYGAAPVQHAYSQLQWRKLGQTDSGTTPSA